MRRARVMPSPLAVQGIDQGQSVNGEVAVEVVFGIEDQRNAQQDGPDYSQSQHDPGPARSSSGGRWRMCRSWRKGRFPVSHEEVAHGATKSGQLGEVLDDVVFVERQCLFVVYAINHNLTTFRENHPDEGDTHFKVFPHFRHDLCETVSRRDHFDSQIRRHRRQTVPDLSAGPASVAVETDIGASYGVWSALRQHSRISSGVAKSGLSPKRFECRSKRLTESVHVPASPVAIREPPLGPARTIPSPSSAAMNSSAVISLFRLQWP